MFEAVFENSVTVVAVKGAMRSSNFEERADGPPRRGRRPYFAARGALDRQGQGHVSVRVTGGAGHLGTTATATATFFLDPLLRYALVARARQAHMTPSGTLSNTDLWGRHL